MYRWNHESESPILAQATDGTDERLINTTIHPNNYRTAMKKKKRKRNEPGRLLKTMFVVKDSFEKWKNQRSFWKKNTSEEKLSVKRSLSDVFVDLFTTWEIHWNHLVNVTLKKIIADLLWRFWQYLKRKWWSWS